MSNTSTSDKDKDAAASQAAATIDFIETLTGDYMSISRDLQWLLARLKTVTIGAIALLLALYVVYWGYVASFYRSSAFDVEVTVAMLFLLGVFSYTYIRIRRSRDDVSHLDFHMMELIESHEETVFQAERLDSGKTDSEQIATILRKADSNLDSILEESPQLLQLNVDVKGKKSTIRASVYVGVPWDTIWDKLQDGALGSKLELVYIAIMHEGPDPMTLTEVKDIHQRLTDILQGLNPAEANVFVFSKVGFAQQTIEFVENDKNWIPHWKEGTDDEELAAIDLIRIRDGRCEVVSLPYLKYLRQERLAMQVA